MFLSTQPKMRQACCNLSILPASRKLLRSCNKIVNVIKLQQACQSQACCNLSPGDLLQLVETACIKPVDNRF